MSIIDGAFNPGNASNPSGMGMGDLTSVPGGASWNGTVNVPIGWRFHNVPRIGLPATPITETSGTSLVGQLWLPANITISNLGFCAGAAATAPTNSWIVLWTYDLIVRAVSANRLTNSIPAGLNVYALTANYTTPYQGYYYCELLQAGTTAATVVGVTGNSTVNGLTPILCGTGATGQTTPPAVGAARAAITAAANMPYFLAA